MSMSPHHYRLVKNKAEDLIERATELATGKRKDGTIYPIYFKAELNDMIMKLSRSLGSLDIYIEGLLKTSNKREEYNALVDEMERLSDALQSKCEEIEQWAKR